ncbi:MAG: F0F1 ATP synthase subunit B [Candidatus Pacebacteria bacterium]|nr:F0F1 ATP synthase subunit B [Candidatus Paceibacterota bacterium]MDD5357202.1 F0F1 ATP synthase subunit B [Candidatus Paceibacterota bacterium]
MSDLLNHLGVDWKLLLAQVVNFAILAFVLGKFAYKPILGMLKKRSDDIEEGLRASEESKERLSKTKIIEEERILAADKKALSMVQAAETTAKVRGEAIMEDSKKKSEGMVESAHKSIEQERGRMAEEVGKEASMFVRMGLEKVIGKMDFNERDNALIAEALKEMKSASTHK